MMPFPLFYCAYSAPVDRQASLLVSFPLASGWRLSMLPKNDKYTYRITWSEEDGEYVGLCAEPPSLSWLSQTPEPH